MIGRAHDLAIDLGLNTASTLPARSVLIKEGPNSLPNRSASPIGWIDLMSKSEPVR
jgi:hypothetical protein